MSDDQGGDSFDLCECVFSHEFAMRRLLNLLRNGQTVCTDNECTDLVSPLNSTSSSDPSEFSFTFFIGMIIFAVILYLMRPNSLRRRNDGLNKSPDDGNSSNDRQPPMGSL